MWKIIIWSGHNFAHVMTAELSWHVQISDLIESQESWLWQREITYEIKLWTHKN